MIKPLIIEPEAEDDLRSAYDWYESRRAGLGDDFILCVEAALEVVRERPKSFPRVRKSARRILVNRFPYLILFVDRREAVVVVGVFHTNQNPRRWTKRLR